MRVKRHWNRLPSETTDTLFLEVLKARLAAVLSKLVQ